MTAVINYLYDITQVIGLPSYGLAIILLTVLIKIVLYPLTQMQMKSMLQMQLLQPELQKIQKKYSKDKQKMQQKMMELYKERKVNPMAGCLVLLIQLPILIALYRALLGFDFSDTAHAGFFWIPILSERDPYYILPVLAAVSTYLQAKMTTPASAAAAQGGNPGAQQTQKIMLYFMPLFIGWISSTLPAGLALYWTVFNIMGIIQQYFINRELMPATEGVADVEGDRKDRKERTGGR
ncbi:MAG: membrane protein insertase YidC [Peptococcaceae bacterium]|nr:membrane protein insertase YidC [Peptococcaceae bacterium]